MGINRMKLRELTCEVNTIQIELKRKIARLHSKYFKCKTAKQHIQIYNVKQPNSTYRSIA
jgi:hypothetical protein